MAVYSAWVLILAYCKYFFIFFFFKFTSHFIERVKILRHFWPVMRTKIHYTICWFISPKNHVQRTKENKEIDINGKHTLLEVNETHIVSSWWHIPNQTHFTHTRTSTFFYWKSQKEEWVQNEIQNVKKEEEEKKTPFMYIKIYPSWKGRR